jgi:hypothetical protein
MEKEGYALVESIRHFKPFLSLGHFLAYTYHQAFSLYATQNQRLQKVVFSDGNYSFSRLTFLFITSMGKGILWPMP